MGVPNSKFKGDSDYKLSYLHNNVEKTPNVHKPADQLKAEGSLETSDTYKDTYKVNLKESNPMLPLVFGECKDIFVSV